MEKKSFNEVIEDCQYLFVENAMTKTADEVAEELRNQIRAMGWECLEDGEDFSDWLEKHADINAEECDEYAVTYNDLEFLCDMEEFARNGRDVDWVQFSITFYGIWGEVGVFNVTH